MFESEYEKEQKRIARLRQLVEGRVFIIIDDDGARYDTERDLLKLGAKHVYTGANGDEALRTLKSLSEQNIKIDLLVTDLVFNKGMFGGAMIDGLRGKKFDTHAYQMDAEGHHVGYGRTLPVLVNSSGAERFRFEGGRNTYINYRGRENLLNGIGRALEDIVAKEAEAAAKTETEFPEPEMKKMTPGEYSRLTSPAHSKRDLFREAERRQHRPNDSHDR